MNYKSFTTSSVSSKDGTVIGYRELGYGPSLILVHGAMMASQNFMKLATLLADKFTVYLPDRRGRGLSGPHGDNYCLDRECEDIQAIINKSNAEYIFGLSSGAIISLEVALKTSKIRKVALYEPPLPIGNSSSALTYWEPRFKREIDQGKLGAALVSVLKGTGDSSLLSKLPRFIVVPLMDLLLKLEGNKVKENIVSVKSLIPTMCYDNQLVVEMENKLHDNQLVVEHEIKNLNADILLLGGSKSPDFLRMDLDGLSSILPLAKRIEFAGLDHLAADNGGKPELVANELNTFFGR